MKAPLRFPPPLPGGTKLVPVRLYKHQEAMKVLILSCDTGEGHNSAAKAISEYLTMNGAQCRVENTLSLASPLLSQAVSDLYIFSTKTNLFKMAYRAGEVVSEGSRMKSPVYAANIIYCRKLLSFIRSDGYDTIICTHLFPAQALTYLRHSARLSRATKCIFVMTDYTCIPFLKETDLDAYVVPHEHLIEECAEKGLPRQKLYPFGIPVRSVFHSRIPRDSARAECAALFPEGIRTDRKWFLIMSGSMGFGDLSETVREILERCRENTETIIVCGRNEALRKKLSASFGNCREIHLLGFTDRIPQLMDASDVLFTKPGGLSSTEAAAKGIPIIHTSPIPGCETRNAVFFHYHNMSYSSRDTATQVSVAMRLCTDSTYRDRMRLAQAMNIRTDTCRMIAGLCGQDRQ